LDNINKIPPLINIYYIPANTTLFSAGGVAVRTTHNRMQKIWASSLKFNCLLKATNN
jgi:hypothetical protein